MWYVYITAKKSHKDTPPMPCNSLEAEKAPFPFLILFSTVVTKRHPSFCSPKLTNTVVQRQGWATLHNIHLE